MKENNGWIKLYRKLEDNPVIMKDGDHLSIWVHLLLNATHKKYEVLFGPERLNLLPGQLITGRKSIAAKLKISESKVQRILKCFESEHQIEQRTSHTSRLITIVNWLEYQNSEQPIEQQVNNDRTTSEQQVNTNKNVKNIKNDKNDKKGDRILSLWIKTFGRNPKVFEREDTESLIKKFGYEVTAKAIEAGCRNGCKKLETLINRIDENGIYKPFENNNNGKDQTENPNSVKARTKYEHDPDNAKTRLAEISLLISKNK